MRIPGRPGSSGGTSTVGSGNGSGSTMVGGAAGSGGPDVGVITPVPPGVELPGCPAPDWPGSGSVAGGGSGEVGTVISPGAVAGGSTRCASVLPADGAGAAAPGTFSHTPFAGSAPMSSTE